MIELMANINAFVNLKTGSTQNINEDFFSSDATEELICRHDASPYKQKEYMDGGAWMGFNFSYFYKGYDVITARQKIEAIAPVLELNEFTDALGITNGRLNTLTRAVPVSKSESGEIIYTSSFRLDYYQGA